MEQLYFTEEHKMLQDMMRDFARKEVKPLAQEIDETGEFPHKSVKKMAELGLMGIPWDEKIWWKWNGYLGTCHCN